MGKLDLKKILSIVGVVLVLGLLIFVLFFYKATIKFNPNPSNARIDIADISRTGQTKIKLSPGTYHVKVSSPGYVDYESTLTAKIAQTINVNKPLVKLPQPEKLTKDSAQFLTSSTDNKTLFYLGDSGKTLFRITNASTTDLRRIEAITPSTFSDIRNVIFSPTQELAILKKDDGTYLYDFKRYDLLHQEIHPWGNDIGNIVWSPDSEKVVYYYQNSTGEKTLIRAPKDNSSQERIYNFKDTTIVNPILDWSKNGQKILLVSNDLYIFDLYSKSLKQLTKGGGITDAKFSPDSQSILFNKSDTTDGITLNITGLDGNNIRNLNTATLVSKVTWFDSKNIICAIPNTTDSGASDKIIKLNLDSFKQIEYSYVSSQDVINLNNIIVSDNAKEIFFLNKNSLYDLKLASTNYED